MTLILAALWIAGHEFHWWWMLVALGLDIVWLSIKLNFMAALVRRSVEASLVDIIAESVKNAPPPPPPPPV